MNVTILTLMTLINRVLNVSEKIRKKFGSLEVAVTETIRL